MTYLNKGEVLSMIGLDSFVSNIWGKQAFWVHRTLIKNGSKDLSVHIFVSAPELTSSIFVA